MAINNIYLISSRKRDTNIDIHTYTSCTKRFINQETKIMRSVEIFQAISEKSTLTIFTLE
jgi:hypothetical protein